MDLSPREVRSPKALIYILLAFLLVLGLRLFWVDFIKAGDLNFDSSQSRQLDLTLTAKRGTIYDRNGTILAVSVDATTIVCDPTKVEKPEIVAKKCSEYLGGDYQDYYDALTTPNTQFAWVERKADYDKANALEQYYLENLDDMAGIYFYEDSKREYPNGQVGGQIIGICDIDGNGISGLELEYDDILKGEDGIYLGEKTSSGTPIPGTITQKTSAVAGEDIMVSIDITMQKQTEDLVEAEVERIGKKGSAILMDGETGEIYAMCSYPYFNPASPEESESGSENLTTITQAFEPGSMMKTVTALGVLEAGTLTPDSEIGVPASLDADEYTITDSWEHGAQTMTLDSILTNSSNIGISLASDTIGAKGVFDNLMKCKILEKTGIDFPGESSGYVDELENWSTIARYNITFGQGMVATPIGITRFYAAIANDGVAVTPHFLINKISSGEQPEYETENLGYSEHALTDITEMLHNVVENHTPYAQISGYDLCGKTSTAEYTENGEYVEGYYNVGFCGFVNNASTKLVCYTGVTEVPYETTSATLFKDIMEFAINRYNVVNINDVEAN